MHASEFIAVHIQETQLSKLEKAHLQIYCTIAGVHLQPFERAALHILE